MSVTWCLSCSLVELFTSGHLCRVVVIWCLTFIRCGVINKKIKYAWLIHKNTCCCLVCQFTSVHSCGFSATQLTTVIISIGTGKNLF